MIMDMDVGVAMTTRGKHHISGTVAGLPGLISVDIFPALHLDGFPF